MNEKVPGSKTSGTTALPNALFDALLPSLGDTELRVLLVVARSTLGWKEGAGRKERDWLSHAQLCKRTGRSNTPVSGAIDSLTRRGLLQVENETGEGLPTPSLRRAARSRLFFRLGSALLASHGPEEETTRHGRHRSGAQHRGAAQPLATLSNETTASDRADIPQADIPQNGFHLVETTKETGTKNWGNHLSFLPSGITRETDEIQQGDDQKALRDEEATRRVRQAFEQAYRTARPDEPMPPTDDETTLALLKSYVGRGYAKDLEAWLPAFFASSFGFVRRRNYSLGAYLDCFFVLQARLPNQHPKSAKR